MSTVLESFFVFSFSRINGMARSKIAKRFIESTGVALRDSLVDFASDNSISPEAIAEEYSRWLVQELRNVSRVTGCHSGLVAVQEELAGIGARN